MMFDTPEGVAFFQLSARAAALRLELKGLRHSRGSVYALCKRVYGLKGNRASVSRQMDELVEKAIAERRNSAKDTSATS